MPQTAAPTRDPRWLALVALCAGMLMNILDQTIVNVALPSIQSDLGFSQASLAWVINAYLIAFGGLLLLAGRLGDLIGRKRLFLAGLFVFTGASVLCGLSPSKEWLIAARFVQGIGGAMSSAVILGVIVTTFPRPAEQARAIGIYSFVAAAGGSIGLLAGGLLTQALTWHWIFLVNLPIGIASGVLAARVLPSDRGIGLSKGADIPGAVLVTSALMLGVYTIVEVPARGWGAVSTVAGGVISVVLLVAFLWRQSTAAEPLLPLGMLRSSTVAGANLVQALTGAGMFGFFFLGTLYLQRVLSYNPTQIGLAFLPVALAIGTLSLGVSAALTTRFGARAVLLPSIALLLIGLILLSRVPVDGEYVADLLPVMLLLGVGAGLAFPSLTTLAMSAATPSDSGLASGVFNTTAQVGGALGLAVLATLATARTDRLLAGGESAVVALTGGYRFAFSISAGLLGAALVLAIVLLKVRTVDERRDTAPIQNVVTSEAA